ncbi:D-alanyl-D-alanine carboxypeptidase family protein [Cellulomonas sp. P22]|uniref:M15 family metallopeptidase n=1 Tax=Cellulomonas sp. P22 TaxID=3373189 RepID=UPI0037A92BD9
MSNRKPIPGWPHRGRADHRAPRPGATHPTTRLVEAALTTWKRPALQLQRLAQIVGLATLVGIVRRSDALETLRAQWVRLRDWAQDQARAVLSSQAAQAVRSSRAYAVVRTNAELVANHSRRTAESIRMHQITQALRARPLAQGVLVAGVLMGISGTAVAAPQLESEPISAVEQDARLATVAEAAASTLAHAQAVGDAANAAELPTGDLEAATAELNRVLSDTTTEPVEATGAPTDATTATDTATLAATTAAVAQEAAQRLEDLQAKLAEAGTEQVEGTDAATATSGPLGAVTEETSVGPLSTDTSATASIADVLTTSAATGTDTQTAAELQSALRQVTGLTEKVSSATGISTTGTAVLGQVPESTVPSAETIAAAEQAAADAAAAAQAAADQAAAEQAAAEQAAAEQAAAEAAAAAQAQRQAADDASMAAAAEHSAKAAAQGSLNFANGQIPDSALCSLSFAPGQALRCDAAAAIEMLNIDYRRTFGTNMSITDSYRSYDAQVRVKAAKPYLATTPGTSNHGWGVALDLGGGIQTAGSAQHRWMQANAVNQHWAHPGWAQTTGSKPEAWHWEFVG